jgi:hypothetical protein
MSARVGARRFLPQTRSSRSRAHGVRTETRAEPDHTPVHRLAEPSQESGSPRSRLRGVGRRCGAPGWSRHTAPPSRPGGRRTTACFLRNEEPGFPLSRARTGKPGTTPLSGSRRPTLRQSARGSSPERSPAARPSPSARPNRGLLAAALVRDVVRRSRRAAAHDVRIHFSSGARWGCAGGRLARGRVAATKTHWTTAGSDPNRQSTRRRDPALRVWA